MCHLINSIDILEKLACATDGIELGNSGSFKVVYYANLLMNFLIYYTTSTLTVGVFYIIYTVG